ncbi:MAG: PilZ domain-containing protein [Cellvibrionaceae bacterium]|nr:PilZ domain-containing protein [Cellvibrionaceae bacterium]
MSFSSGTRNDASRNYGSDIERRRYERKATSIRVEIMHPSIGVMVGSTQDISDGGASVQIDNHSLPPIGTVVSVRFIKMVGTINEEPVAMKVMYQQRNTLGLMFT